MDLKGGPRSEKVELISILTMKKVDFVEQSPLSEEFKKKIQHKKKFLDLLSSA